MSLCMDLIKLHVCSLYNESLQIHSETHHLHIILEQLRREKENPTNQSCCHEMLSKKPEWHFCYDY